MAAIGIVVEDYDLIDKIDELRLRGFTTLGFFHGNGEKSLLDQNGKVVVWQCDDFGVVENQQTILTDNGYKTYIGHTIEEICSNLFPDEQKES